MTQASLMIFKYDWNLNFLNIELLLVGWFMVFNAVFNNISVISRQPVLVVEEAGLPGDNHRPWASNW